MKLIIVESPSKAKTIEKYLGGDYRVAASSGHVCDLPVKSLGIDIENNFKPEYVLTSDKKKIENIERIKAAIKKADEVYLATDPDREGEAISWHLSNILDLQGGKRRIVFNEISKKAVMQAIENPREINENLVNSQQARRVLDRLIGYKISPIISKKIRNNLSAGRVQSAALRMLVDREREIQAFVPEEYWTLAALLSKITDSTVFKAMLTDKNGEKLKVTNGEYMQDIVNAVQNNQFIVDTVKKSITKAFPAPPFTTSTLQQDAFSKMGISAPQTMQIAQNLYEGVDVAGEGSVALVTYIRTDSVRVSLDAQFAAKDYIIKEYGSRYVPQRFNMYKSKSDAQDAHEAIRPIHLERTPESLKDKISRNHYRVYKLIYERFLASQMVPAEFDSLTARIKNGSRPSEYGFKVSGKVMRFQGFTIVYNHENEKNDDDESTESMLPPITEGETLKLHGLKHEQKFTKPPPRFTDASIIKALEENGIGRPSTYASIISVLSKREYTFKEGKYMIPTDLGFSVCDLMLKFFGDIIDLSYTASMEDDLDKIELGEKEWQKVIAEFYPTLKKHILNAYADNQKTPAEESDVVCEKCGAKMVFKDGRYGRFLACPNYPQCKNIKSLAEVVGKCPMCGSDIQKKISKNGKTFYGCAGYPRCKFMSWEIPAPHLCPRCANPMYIQNGEQGRKYVCSDKKCGLIEIAPSAGQ